MRFPMPDTGARARARERARTSRVYSPTRSSIEREEGEGERGSQRAEGEPSGEHVRSFRDSCFEFATRRATACRKGGKKIACRRATPRVGCADTSCPIPRHSGVYPLGERAGRRSIGEREREREKERGKEGRREKQKSAAGGGDETGERSAMTKGGRGMPASRAAD